MHKERIFKAPAGAKFIGDFWETLPNGILNKMETGCGATSVVLTNTENVVTGETVHY